MTGCKMVESKLFVFNRGVFILICSGLFLLCAGKNHHDGVCDFVPAKKIDTAYLTLQTESLGHNISLRAITSECHTCHLQTVAFIEAWRNSCTVLVDTRWNMKLAILSNDTKDIVDSSCSEKSLSQLFLEGGNYSLYVTNKNDKISCNKAILMNSPIDSNIPIYVAMGIFMFLAILWVGGKTFLRSHFAYRIVNRFSSHSNSFIDPDGKTERHEPPNSPAQASEPSPVRQYNLRQRKGHVTPKSSPKQPKSSNIPTTKNTYTVQDLGSPPSEDGPPRAPQRERLKSLDTFRGIAIVVMIFVNYRGGDYWFFRHSKWNGITVADLVFPCVMCFVNYGGGGYWYFNHTDWNGLSIADTVMAWFVWIMGTSMVFSFKSLLTRATPKTKIFWKIFKRSCILFVLGLLINSSDGLNAARMKSFRVPGVLQRFAGTYFIVATIHMFCARSIDQHQYTWWSFIRDIAVYWVEWIFNLALVFLWLALTFLLPVKGCPTGYLGPGGLANDGHNVSQCTGGAAALIDTTIFGKDHIYQHPTCKEIYESTMPHDPEGLLGTLTSCFMCFLGLQAGKILLMFPDWKARVKRFLIWGIVLGLIAVVLCKGEQNGGFIPINKNLWSLTYVICLSSFAFFLFAFCYVTIDVYKIWSGAPFYYPGMNAILLYMCHEFFNQPFRRFWGIEPNSHTVYLAINTWDTTVWVLLAYYLHRKQIFLSV